MLIFFQLQFVVAYWEVYYSFFNAASLLYCQDTRCPFGFKQNTSGQSALYKNCTNPKGTALILQDSQMSTVSNQYSNSNPYSFSHTIVFDVYYITEWNNDALTFEYKNQAYQFIYSTQNPLKFENGACNSDQHEVRTYQISLPYTNQFTNIKLSISNSQTKALIKNIHFSYISCHPTCKTCTGGKYNECTSCISDVSLQDGICQCPKGKSLNYGRCLDYCLLELTDRRKNYCKYYQTYYFLYLNFYSFHISQLIRWDTIYDPRYLNNENKKMNQLFGVFRYNEGASTIVNTTYFVHPLGVQLYIFMCNATPINSGISLYLNDTYYSSMYYDGTQYIGINLYIYSITTTTLSGCQTAQAILLYTNLFVEQGGFTFSIKGNFSAGNSGWYLAYVQMSSAQCPVYCLKCDKDYICSKCLDRFKIISNGNCVNICPKTSKLLNNYCINYDQVTKYSKYFIKQFYDFTVPDNIKSSFILESSTSIDIQKGDEIYWSYIETNVVFGGKYVWAKARFSQIYTINSAYHSLTIYFDAVFGCNFDGVSGYLGYSVNNQTEQSVSINSTININVTTPLPTLTIAFQCYGATNNVLDKYCAISHYYIVVHYCSPYCLQCTDENTCQLMDTFDTSIVIIDPSLCSSSQYYDDEYLRCEECNQECETCLNEIECLTCKYPYQILVTKCVLQCKINEYFDESTQICDQCNSLCKQCKLKNECINCEQQKFRYLFYDQCLCYDGYYDDNIHVKCQVCDVLCTKCFGPSNINCNECISIDKVEKIDNTCNCQSGYYFEISNLTCMQCHKKCISCFSSSENSCLSCSNLENRNLDGLYCSCQTGYFEVNDICVSCPNIEDSNIYQCYKQCGDNSIIWFNQVCQPYSCLSGFTNQNNLCIPICGDLIINGNEECDDGNSILDDGCYNCRYQCPKQCLTCNQFTILPCPNICGDGIISGSEECDDGNLIQFDGCYQCKLECQIQCSQCMKGQCYQCQTYGWIVDINSKTCVENCSDSIIIGREQCDDGYNFNQNDGCYQCKRVCRDDCLRCSSDGTTCLECKVIGFQPISYYCKNICLDGYLAIDPYGRNSEECDDFNSIDFDGCSNVCKFQCQTILCKTCVNNKCLECIDYYYLDFKKNKCIEICNDNILIGQEKCEDMNSLIYDGCYNCQLSCQPSCQNCTINGCLSCIQGYQLIGIRCDSICGDRLIVPEEDCEDNNLEPFDGCHACKYSCNSNCETCYFGKCIRCQLGYRIYNGLCEKDLSFFNNKLYIQNYDANLNKLIQNQSTKEFNEFCKEAINDTCLVCEDYYYLNSITSICQSKCGDTKISGYEQCDNLYNLSNRICNQCQFFCKENCSNCLFGICQQCEEGYIQKQFTNSCELEAQCNEIGLYTDIINNVCYEICGDGLISKSEQCEDDNDDPYDGCYKCKYSCYPACPLCILGQCLDDGNACDLGYYFDNQTVQCFNICGDGIIAIPDEECDNGMFSDDQDDQCQNCKLICNKTCQICDQNKQCIQCKDNFELINGKCYSKNLNLNLCQLENCEYCEDSQCITCSIGYVYYPIENLCQPVCGDGVILGSEDCDDGNSINGDGCDSNCKPSLNSQCKNNQCIYISYPIPLLKFEKEIDNTQIVYLTYDQQVKLQFNYSISMFINSIQPLINNKVINVTYSEISSLDYETYKYLQMEIKIQYEEIITNPIFSIHFADLNIIINQFEMTSNHQDIQLQLPSPNVLTEEQKQLTQSLIQFSGIQIKILAGLILASSLSGKFEIIQNQIDSIQQLYYLKYINTRKGQNLLQFFGTFKIIQLTNIYDFIGFNPSNDLFFGFSYQKSEEIFEEDGRNANYISNFIQISTVLFFAYITHLMIKIWIQYSMNKILNFQIFNLNFFLQLKIKLITRFSINNCRNKFSEQFQGMLQSLLYEYTISSILSLMYQDLNLVEGKLSLIMNGGIIYLLFNYLLFLKHSNQKFHIYFTYSCVQKMLFATILIICFKSAILQIQLCALNEFIYFYYLFKQKRLIDKFEQFKKYLTHFNLFIINLMYLVNELYKNDPFKIIQIGWVIIGMMSSILSITLLVDVIKLLQPFIQNILNRLKPQRPTFKNHEILDQIEQRNMM